MARTGLWVIEMDQDRAPRMYSDKAMLELLGLKEMPSRRNVMNCGMDGSIRHTAP